MRNIHKIPVSTLFAWFFIHRMQSFHIKKRRGKVTLKYSREGQVHL